MKIGLVTITDRENYGNRLQNYAIEKLLISQGCIVETIRKIMYKKTLIEKIKFFIRKYTGIKYSRYWKRVNTFNKFNKKYIHFSKDYISTDTEDYELSQKYDAFLCGSDQIWNSNFAFNSDSEFLSFVVGKKKIAVSASFGFDKIISEKEKKRVGDLLDKIDDISVREESGKIIVEEISHKKAIVLSDPTVILDATEWTEIEKKPKKFHKKKFIVCYILGVYDESVLQNIKNYATQKKVDIVFLENDYYKYKITTEEEFAYGPSEFLWLIRNAEKVITDSFHAAVFSLIFEKKFAIISGGDAEKKMGSRFEQLSHAYGVKNIYALDNRYDLEAEYDANYVKKTMKMQKKEFEKYLKQALGVLKEQ